MLARLTRPEEVTEVGGYLIAPAGTAVDNRAFDVTPAHLVTALITEDGVSRGSSSSALSL